MQRNLTSKERACLEAARLMVCTQTSPVYAMTDGRLVLSGRTVCTLNPSGDCIDALVVTLSGFLRHALDGFNLVQLRDDLVASGVREDVADGIHDHVAGLSDYDWALLRARVDWYDEASQARRYASTADIGVF